MHGGVKEQQNCVAEIYREGSEEGNRHKDEEQKPLLVAAKRPHHLQDVVEVLNMAQFHAVAGVFYSGIFCIIY